MIATSPCVPPAAATLGWTWAGRRVLVMGLGSFGGTLGAIRWLARQGAQVTVTDRADAARLADSCRKIADLNVRLRLGGHDESDLDGADLLVVSPAVNKLHSDFFQAARERGIGWTSEMNLFLERCPAPIIGITGSAGKSTVCAMVHAIVTRAVESGQLPMERCWLGGNIGVSLLDHLDAMTPAQVVVLELSSFQLEDAAGVSWSPQLAVITNITANHLDRHHTFEAYQHAKLNIIRARRVPVSPRDTAEAPKMMVVCGSSDESLRTRIRAECAARGAELISAPAPSKNYPLMIPGEHNQRNAELAATTCRTIGIDPDTIINALRDFAGLPHRLQFIRQVNGVDYYDDSKATTPQEAAMALAAFDRPIVAIVGGQRRVGGDWQVLSGALRERADAVVFTGECGLEWLTEARAAGESKAPMSHVPRIPDAVSSAAATAKPGTVVLLTPGAPSYDQFRNYEERGQCYQQAVQGLNPG